MLTKCIDLTDFSASGCWTVLCLNHAMCFWAKCEEPHICSNSSNAKGFEDLNYRPVVWKPFDKQCRLNSWNLHCLTKMGQMIHNIKKSSFVASAVYTKLSYQFLHSSSLRFAKTICLVDISNCTLLVVK